MVESVFIARRKCNLFIIMSFEMQISQIHIRRQAKCGNDEQKS